MTCQTGARRVSGEPSAADHRWFAQVSWLDVKLALRMFAKYPGLSLVAVAGMAIAIAIGAGYFSIVSISSIRTCRSRGATDRPAEDPGSALNWHQRPVQALPLVVGEHDDGRCDAHQLRAAVLWMTMLLNRLEE